MDYHLSPRFDPFDPEVTYTTTAYNSVGQITVDATSDNDMDTFVWTPVDADTSSRWSPS